MTDEPFGDLVGAYRGEHSARTMDTRALRARIVAAAGRARFRSVDRLRLLLPIAATFVGSVALAARPPARQKVRDLVAFVGESLSSSKGAPPVVAPGTRGGAVVVLAPLAPGVTSPPSLRSPSAPPTAAPVPIRGASSRDGVGSPSTPAKPRGKVSPLRDASPEPAAASFAIDPLGAPADAAERPSTPAAPSADLRHYRTAHALHFSGADRSAVLRAWDSYLASFPRGTFAPEARLNRGVCLAQLGRRSDAERVLSDIERGRFGEPGRSQARRVLDALGSED
jgi:hypothetical protein